MKITVYLASHLGADASFRALTAELGTWLGREGHVLIYGGSDQGLMGILADSSLAAGGQVTGIIPTFLKAREIEHTGLTHLIEVEDMTERKQLLREQADLFIALPGGPGTLEEISEIISMARLDQLTHPIILYNMAGFYDSLRDLFDNMLAQGFITTVERDKVIFLDSLDQIAAIVAEEERSHGH